MNKYEKSVIRQLEKHSVEIGFIVVVLFGITIRLALRHYVSDDAERFLLPWYDTIKANGGIKSLSRQVGDYNVLYQFLIAVFTYLPLNVLTDYKLMSIIFDILLSAVGGLIVWKVTEKNMLKAFMCTAAVFLSPIVFLNSACWGQCDSIYTFFCIMTLFLLMEKHYKSAFCMYGLAFAFKLQAVFLLPFMLLYYLRKKDFSILKFLYVPIMMILTGIPALIQGRTLGDIFGIYSNQVGEYTYRLVWNYSSFWNLFYNIEKTQYVEMLSRTAIVLTMTILLVIAVWVVVNNVQMTDYNSLWLAFLTSYACVLFLPSMHERYGYMCETFSLLMALLNKKTILLMIPMQLCTWLTYAHYLFGLYYYPRLMTVINLLVFVGYCMIGCREMRNLHAQTN